MDELSAIRDAIAGHGLILRGGFHPEPADGVPGRPGTLVMVGNAGPGLWEAFGKACGPGPDPLDAWTREALSGAAARLGATALFPFDGPPYLPFQRWAMRAEAVFASPIGPLVHPEYGLWHAYRGALAFTARLALPPRREGANPCASCATRPCLSSCPVEALAPGAYDVPACATHVDGPAGRDCLDRGCAARRACPVGRDFVYAPAQARFHMDAFRRANRPGPEETSGPAGGLTRKV